VRFFYREELGKTIPDYMAFYRSSLSFEEASGAIVRAIPDWVAVDPPLFGDVLVFRITRAPWHTGIFLDGGRMLHTDEGHGSVIEPIGSVRWRDRFYGAYRWKF
jgi:cell wall-associated NlpC family hydrolase